MAFITKSKLKKDLSKPSVETVILLEETLKNPSSPSCPCVSRVFSMDSYSDQEQQRHSNHGQHRARGRLPLELFLEHQGTDRQHEDRRQRVSVLATPTSAFWTASRESETPSTGPISPAAIRNLNAFGCARRLPTVCRPAPGSMRSPTARSRLPACGWHWPGSAGSDRTGPVARRPAPSPGRSRSGSEDDPPCDVVGHRFPAVAALQHDPHDARQGQHDAEHLAGPKPLVQEGPGLQASR